MIAVASELDWRPVLLFALGALLVCGTIVKSALRRFDVPALVGYLLLGVLLRVLDDASLHLPDEAWRALDVLADLGIVCLLFRVGLESDIRILLRELPRASVVLVTSMATSFAFGFVAARGLGFELVPSLFVAVALSATSIAVAAFVWEGEGKLKTPTGALVLDVAELDDLATVLLMVVLFTMVPAMVDGGDGGGAVLPALLSVVGKIVVFGGACWLLSRYVERPLVASFRRLRHAPDLMLVIVGVAILVASFAAWLGFSLAVGALFAGLVFSRDPRAVRVEGSFQPVHDLLAPFFFVAVGSHLDFAVMGESLWVGAVLLVAAVAGKLLGTMLGVFRSLPTQTGWVVAVSMVPRAEVALFVCDQGRRLLPDHVPASIQGGMVLVVAGTCLITPPVLRRLLSNRARTAASRRRRRG